ncbi:MAG: HlyD family efflux transporter periplasmic adaptor subunit [Terriglobales bacterium]
MADLEVVPRVEEEREEEKQTKARGYLKRNPRAKWIALAVVLLLLVGGLFVWHYFSIRESTDDAQIEGDIIPISARVGGTVQRVLFDDNQYVEAGAILVTIDQADYKIALDRAEADLADAQAGAQAAKANIPITSTTTASQTETARANLVAAQRDVEAAQSRVAEAQANEQKAAADLERYRQLVQKDEVPRQTYETAVATEASTRAVLDSSHAAVAVAQSKVLQAEAQLRSAGTAPQQIEVTRGRAGSAAASVMKSTAAVEQARLNLEYTTVRAPVSGIVSKKSVQPGQVISPGQPLVALVPTQNMWVVANFKETQLKNMHPGQSATIHVDAYGRDYKGHVDSFGGATAARFSLLPPENATGNYVKVVQRVPVKIVFEKDQDPEHRLRPGLSVTPTVITK